MKRMLTISAKLGAVFALSLLVGAALLLLQGITSQAKLSGGISLLGGALQWAAIGGICFCFASFFDKPRRSARDRARLQLLLAICLAGLPAVSFCSAWWSATAAGIPFVDTQTACGVFGFAGEDFWRTVWNYDLIKQPDAQVTVTFEYALVLVALVPLAWSFVTRARGRKAERASRDFPR